MHERVLCQLPDCEVNEDDCGSVRRTTKGPMISSASATRFSIQPTANIATTNTGYDELKPTVI